MKWQNINDPSFKRMLGVISLGSILFGITIRHIIFPVILKHQINKEMSLRNNSELKDMWIKLPFPLEMKIWLFNVTNPIEANRGEKPILQEVGPYVYEKWMEKVDLVENDDEDSIAYNIKDTYYFKPEYSQGLTGDEMLYSPQMLLIGTASYATKYEPSHIDLVSKALNIIFNNPEHVFPLHKAKEVLFEGVKINCTSSDISVESVCSAYKNIKGLDQYLPNHFKYSIFGHANRTQPDRYKVLRGIRNIDDVGRVIEYNGNRVLNTWSSEECNSVSGSDTTIYRPFVNKKEILWTFAPDTCRSIPAVYEKNTMHSGIKAYRFTIDFSDTYHDRDRQLCYCPNGCPPSGLMDLYECLKAVVVISLPHFYKVDESVRNHFIGLNPQKDKHELIFDFEPISGSPLYARKRIQVNTPIMNIPNIKLFSKLPNTYFPILWFEESFFLNKTYTDILRYQLFYPKKVVTIVKWVCVFGGFVGSILTVYLYQRERMIQKNETHTSDLDPSPGAIQVSEAQRKTQVN